MPEAKGLVIGKIGRAVRRTEVPMRKVACELAMSTDFVDPQHIIIALQVSYRTWDAEAVVNIQVEFPRKLACGFLRQSWSKCRAVWRICPVADIFIGAATGINRSRTTASAYTANAVQMPAVLLRAQFHGRRLRRFGDVGSGSNRFGGGTPYRGPLRRCFLGSVRTLRLWAFLGRSYACLRCVRQQTLRRALENMPSLQQGQPGGC